MKPYKVSKTAAKGGKMGLTVAIAVAVTNEIPILQEYAEIAIPLIAGTLKMITNLLSERFGLKL